MKLKTLALTLGTLLAAAPALAQNYPSKPITMVVGFAAGGATDAVARIIAKHLGDELKQNVIVENKAGAGGNIATDYVARAEADGHTLLLGSVGSLTVAPHMQAKLPYKPLQDFAPVTMAVVFSNVLVVKPDLPVKNLSDYIKLAKAKPGTITYASSGVGGAGHLAGELLEQSADVDMTHVAYKGGGPAMLGMLGGEVDSFFGTPPSVGKHVQAGKVRAIATTGAKRDPLMPDVPTVAEQGYPGYDTMNWYAYVVPAKTPQPIVTKLNQVLVKILKDPVVAKELEAKGLSPSPSTPAELGAYMKREYDIWAVVVKKAGIKPE
ncbi:tripartite tricarboxylate transporter substrate binding protein [Rhodoferax sp. BAB1]|uniref:Bug family tripartite tricarboxylate transporter substrate binding protein n=1 Tax=Rhodoferax sp. BAB1 TaxID=2741720 RepID=UPI001575F418|nr:tripartite tricarboxylate transporter substrate binding protein [Rhodoferax sp. BAB1]QKO21382.1 tripartite tricarboxylate transporter substrate binding protein [Rhodoferax sp. BAB1]